MQRKEKNLEQIERIFRQRKVLLLLTAPILLFLFYITRGYKYSVYVLVLFLLLSTVIFPVIYFIKRKKDTLSSNQINFLLCLVFSFELICSFFLFYFLYPFFIFYFKEIYFPLTLFYIIFIIALYPIFEKRVYNYYFVTLCSFLLFLYGLFDYFGFFPSYPTLMISKPLPVNKVFSIFISLFSCFTVFFIIQLYINNFWEMLRKQKEELKRLNLVLEKKIKERTEELEEAKNILEIKVRARTRELRELAESLDEKVKEKTRELQEKIEELEKFHRLAVGRELKMIELKEEIKKLKEEIKKLKGET